jgi:hypothetical protein
MRLTASGIGRALRCAWWIRPDVELPDSGSSRAADEGVLFHDVMARFINRMPQRMHDVERVQYLTEAACEWWGKRAMNRSFTAEDAFALDVVTSTARSIGRMIDRQYGVLGEQEIAGTSDYVGLEADVLVVGDWKTGSPEHVEDVADNAQMKFNALCAAKHMGHTGAVQLEIAYVRKSKVWLERHLTSRMELESFGDDLRRLYLGVRGAESVTGDHCRFCPGAGRCPATRVALTELQSTLGVTARAPVWTTEFLSAENDALMVERLPALENAIDAVKTELKKRAAAQGGIELSSGKVYREVVYTKNVFDRKTAETLIPPERLSECMREQTVSQFRVVKR